MDKLQTDLNPQQYQVVTNGDGPMLVVAGAGSGKTKTLAYRVAYLISKGISPERILLLTFTRRAAKEMLDRATKALGRESSITAKVWGGTFHAIANRLLRIYSSSLKISPEFTIIDQTDSEDLLNLIRHRIVATEKKGRFPRKGTLQAIYSRRMNSGENLEFILKKHFPWCVQWTRELKEIYKEYVAVKQKHNTLDYDDLLVYWYYLLEEEKSAEVICNRFDHILVDEYQDTNRLQSDILVKMRISNKNIMAVGDDCQSIYSFRGATVRNMLDFPKIFPGTKIIPLEQNYRSTEPILNTTNLIISQARERYSKNLFSTRKEGERPSIITCKDESDEADIVIGKILYHYEQGIALREQAVLFRAGSHSAALEIALMKKNIPFHKFGGLKFLEAAHVKDFIAIVRIMENKQDEMAWFRILQLMDGVGPSTASSVFENFRNNNFDLESLCKVNVSPLILHGLKRLEKILVESKDDTPLGSQLEMVSKFYQPLLEKNYENSQPRKNDIEQIVQLSSNFKSRTQFLTDIILDPPSSTSDLAGKSVKDEDYLILSTIHSSKGCEWKAVYLIHAADGCLPSDLSTSSEEEIEEELRLTYVAVTRAKDYLYVTWPLRFYSHPQGTSDRHVYSQCSRFFTPKVLESMNTQASAAEQVETEKSSVEIKGDVKSKMREFWD
jgi:DNA helicase-2/ATP-dependent DNA helicase PcrA